METFSYLPVYWLYLCIVNMPFNVDLVFNALVTMFNSIFLN